ncbi:lamin tail domain-containing protein [Rufibacter sp. DG15C]|uniref:lamin tail domain-containing protein n=1 Tax=Rufibacter sp. DG15C TaxID=1379909 RepID=UPI000834D20A|nr:lamin tail domain-containing protein [Rufibacter sp. DG15C]
MRQLFLLIMLWFALCGTASAQLRETFADGDFTQNPAWTGDVASFQVNAAQQLQSKGPAVTGTTLQLMTPNTLAVGVQWEFYLQLNFATSSGNYAEVHLTSDNQDLKGAHQGYFVRIGGTEDEVSLYRKDGGTAVRIINGPDKTVATSNNLLRVRVTRTEASVWNLEVDMGATGQNYVSQGTAQDARYTTSVYTGVRFTYSQANAQKFYFDDFSIKDIGLPTLTETKVLGPRSLEVKFSEPVTETSVQNLQNYLLNGNRNPNSVEIVDPSTIRLTFASDFATGANTLQMAEIVDVQGNTARNLQTTFDYVPIAQPGDVRITEIYADLNPLQDLPAAEFFEVHNQSDKTFNLQNWKYSDATTNTAIFPSYLLKPGAYVIVTAAADTALYKPFGEVVGLSSFPSLNDAGDEVELYNAQGQLLDKVTYTNAWYRDAQKKEGGWTLELVDANTACTGAVAWKASEYPSGGTPGKVNSVQGKDASGPILVQAVTTSPDKVKLTFDEPLDSLAAAFSLYRISPEVVVSKVQVLPSGFSEVELTLQAPLRENVKYTVTVQGVRDCAGNVSASQQMVTLVLPAEAQKGDVVINEILFNPGTGGVDFVELVNRTDKYLNLQNWQVANREKGEITNAKTISAQPLLLAPNAYWVLTADAKILREQYPNGKPDTFHQLTSLPSFNDDAGNVVLLLPDKTVMDEVAYSADQHFKLIKDPEGISLERMQLAGPSVAANFHSAATAVKATPGYLNSQAQTAATPQSKKLTLEPKVFTPDGDGVDDVLLMQFSDLRTGTVAQVTIYDGSGRPVRKLANNSLAGSENLVQWDGLTDKGTKAAIGYYIVLVELFNLNGEKEIIKETTVVGGRF